MLADGYPVQQVTADELPGESDPDPASGHCGFRQPLRHQVVERPVQMRQRHIHEHPCHRQFRRRGLHGGRPPPWRPAAPGPARPPRGRSDNASRLVPIRCHAPSPTSPAG